LSHPKLHVDAGGSKGTPSYMPPLLEAETSLHVGPVSDRFARDMLLIEILAFQGGDPIDTSPLYWSGQDELLADIANLAKSLQLEHLLDMSVFSLQESERPSSFDLASRIQLNVEDNTRPSARIQNAKLRGMLSAPTNCRSVWNFHHGSRRKGI